MDQGSLCIVLHGHLPYVLNHGIWPHGENWLFEAAAETYLPLLQLLESAVAAGRPVQLTVGLTPVLLEQLAHADFKTRFVDYLRERRHRAMADADEFRTHAHPDFARLADAWADRYAGRLEQFESLDRDLPAAFARFWSAGDIQLLTSNATHCYMPLVLNDHSLRAQLACGIATSTRLLGRQPTGMWLPECAYRPEWPHWVPSVLFNDARHRPGLESFIADAGVTHFFVESSLVTRASVMGTRDADGSFQVADDHQMKFEPTRGWREPLSPVGVVSSHEPPRVFAFARHPSVSELVWSGTVGYPGDGAYLEFHRQYGEHGLRYHRVTDTQTSLSDKAVYEPTVAARRVAEHAAHFVDVVRDTLAEYQQRTGSAGCVVASFDAELFGHWWFEGPQFLAEVIRLCQDEPSFKLRTAEAALAAHGVDKVMRLPEGSWGEQGDHRVWINDRNRFYWEIEYRAENRFLELIHRLPWRDHSEVHDLLVRAARELLLLQASDWSFVIHTNAAADYGIERLSLHAVRFDRMCTIADRVARGEAISSVERVQIAEADAHDGVFPDIDLGWWMSPDRR